MSAPFSSSFDVLAEPGGLETLLISGGALSLLVDVKAAADTMGIDAGSFAVLAVRRFVERAGDEDWASITSGANAQEDALGSIVAGILRKAVVDANEAFK